MDEKKEIKLDNGTIKIKRLNYYTNIEILNKENSLIASIYLDD